MFLKLFSSISFMTCLPISCISDHTAPCGCMLSRFSHVQLFAMLWTVACQAPLSRGFSRQEYWSALPCPPPEDLPNPGTEPVFLVSPELTGEFFTTSATWKALITPSIQFSRSVVSDTLQPHESQHARTPCPSPTPGVYSNSCPSSQWCHPAISSSVVPFSSCPQSLLASGSFPMSQLFAQGGQSFGVSASASVLPMNTQDWSPLGWTVWISLQS